MSEGRCPLVAVIVVLVCMYEGTAEDRGLSEVMPLPCQREDGPI